MKIFFVDMQNIELIRKYNIPGPRYTSYPTVPYWDLEPVDQDDWKRCVKGTYDKSKEEGISLYIHLPYCESLCTYCGCNTRITVNHAVERPYIDAVLREWSLYLELFDERPVVREIHLGGGTPTFFSAANLRMLISTILESADIHPEHEFGFEAHPNNTTAEHLQTLYDLGFRRLSLGIQDFDPRVQEIVNRIQPVEKVAECTQLAREIGYTSINYDLIYGLPLQTLESVKATIRTVTQLRPERIAFYSYAHVPWIKPGQRKFTEQDLPEDEVKRSLYENGRMMLEEAGYKEIGMDHFALQSDGLYQSFVEGKLHRNFMGYTTTHTELLVGLGASSISDSWNGFVQNLKKVEDYIATVGQGMFPFYRGHLLNEEDLMIRKHILNIMCRFKTEWNGSAAMINKEEILTRLKEMSDDKLIDILESGVRIKPEGQAFVRNACMAFDARLWRKEPKSQLFSKVI